MASLQDMQDMPDGWMPASLTVEARDGALGLGTSLRKDDGTPMSDSEMISLLRALRLSMWQALELQRLASLGVSDAQELVAQMIEGTSA